MTSNLWHGTSGPPAARIVIVGEAWGREELFSQCAFVGQSGQELERMCEEAGLPWASILRTNVFNLRPPENDLARILLPYDRKAPSYRGINLPHIYMPEISRLQQQLEAFPRDLVIAAGNWPLWALTDKTGLATKSLGTHSVKEPSGITSWRGSQIYSDTLSLQLKVLPIIHPAAILREWAYRQTTVQDLRRAHRTDDWQPEEMPDIRIPRSISEIGQWFLDLILHPAGPIRLANDIETYKGLITTIGFGHGNFDSNGKALVIPLVRSLGGGAIESWWPVEEEAQIYRIIGSVFSSPDWKIEGQNFLYDTQYYLKFLGIEPRLDFDTMRAQHMLFPGTPKGLDYLSSLYCHYHRYWKDDGKDWSETGNQLQNLLYNGEDCLRTFECATTLRNLISHFGMEEQWEWEKRKMALALRMMRKGIRIDMEARKRMKLQVMQEQFRIHQRLAGLIPDSIVPVPKSSKKRWWESEHQQRELFYNIMGLSAKQHRKTKRPTINDEALNQLEEEYPELSTIFGHLKAERSLGVFNSNFLEAQVDPDGRMRSSFGVAETHRWTSSANVFGSGTNLQNIPSGDEE